MWSVSLKCIKSKHFNKCKKNIPKKRSEVKVVAILRVFIGDIGRSLRNACLDFGLSYTLVRDILHKDLNFKP